MLFSSIALVCIGIFVFFSFYDIPESWYDGPFGMILDLAERLGWPTAIVCFFIAVFYISSLVSEIDQKNDLNRQLKDPNLKGGEKS